MATYRQILTKIETLKQQAEQQRQKEIGGIVADIRQKMQKYGVTPEDLGFKRPERRKRRLAAKYKNPATGETWSGRGRPPAWMVAAEKKGKKRDSFLIK